MFFNFFINFNFSVSIKNCSFTWKLLVVGNLFSLFFNVLVWLTCHEHFNQAHILCTCGRLWVFIPFYRCPAFAFIMTATTKTIHCCRCCNFHNKAKKNKSTATIIRIMKTENKHLDPNARYQRRK